MPFCSMCGNKLSDQVRFCDQCGAPTGAVTPIPQPIAPTIPFYIGSEKRFPLMGRELVISAGMDTFNAYRKSFRILAQQQARALEAEYLARITNLDTFFIEFPQIYAKYRQPLLDRAMEIILQNGVFDLSAQQFDTQHTADFCLCAETVNVLIEAFNNTIEANQDRKIRMYNMMPGVVFSGIGGFAAALALNVAVNSIAEADIRNANVTQKQRAELFGRIDTALLMEHAFLDYWRVFLSMTWQLNRKGIDVWYPTDAANESATGLLQNLTSGMLPPDRIPDLYIRLLQLNPYNEDPMTQIPTYLGITPETQAIIHYFSLND